MSDSRDMQECTKAVFYVGDPLRMFSCGGLDDLSEFSQEGAKNACCRCVDECCADCTAITDGSSLQLITQRYDCETEDYLAVFLGLLAIVCWIVGVILQSRRYRAREAGRLQRLAAMHAAAPTSSNNVDPEARYEQILSRFYFQTVRTDMSNTNAESVRTTPATVEKEEDEQERTTGMNNILQHLTTPWKNNKEQECCICLEGYHPGETICVALTTKCNHIFHQHCVVEWLQTHDKCPLCRIDLMNEDDAEDGSKVMTAEAL